MGCEKPTSTNVEDTTWARVQNSSVGEEATMALTNDTADAVHELLLRPDAYPDGSDKVELKETHISWVYLTKRLAYKRKKPVRFDFLDFSTPERRKQFCEQELQLNRRLSPEIYLSVLPICRSPKGNLNLTGDGEPVDWLVKMKRLDEDETLENIIRRGTVSEVRMKALAQTLSSFYAAQAPAVLLTHDYRKAVSEHIQANRYELQRILPQLSDVISYSCASQWRFLHLMGEIFDERVCDGRVVDGHGDLRPEHVYFKANKPLIIDCIEFDAEYRRNDILDELAFLAMECDRLDAASIGEVILDTYVTTNRDFADRRLVAFFKSYRACVRAKIAALRSEQLDPQPKQMALGEAATYLQLAARYCAELGPPLIVMVGGLMGSGKSTLADHLVGPLAGSLLQTDALRQEIYGQNGRAGYGEGKYAPAARQAVYTQMLQQIPELLGHTPTVVLDGTFASRAVRDQVQQVANQLGAALLPVRCICPRDVSLQRIANRIKRGDSVSEARSDLYDQHSEEFEIWDQAIRVDTTSPLSSQVDVVYRAIRQINDRSNQRPSRQLARRRS